MKMPDTWKNAAKDIRSKMLLAIIGSWALGMLSQLFIFWTRTIGPGYGQLVILFSVMVISMIVLWKINEKVFREIPLDRWAGNT